MNLRILRKAVALAHALYACYCTMNEKFSILHEAKLSAVLKISSSLYSKQVRVFENTVTGHRSQLTAHSSQVVTTHFGWAE